VSKNTKSEAHVISVARKIIEARGGDFKAWSDEAIIRYQIALFQGDIKWKAKILEEECQKLINVEVEKRIK